MNTNLINSERMKLKLVIIFMFLFIVNTFFGQKTYVDPLIYHGQKSLRAGNVHDGNQIRTHFFNYGLIGRNIDEQFGGEWPKNSGHEYVGDVSINVGANVRMLVDTASVINSLTNGAFKPGNPLFDDSLDKRLTKLSREVMVTVSDGPRQQNEYAPDRKTFWGWEPIPGFNSPDTPTVAMSHQPDSWPDTWPDKLDQGGWPASWNGYFGRNQFNADQESYFRMDDYQDQEFKKAQQAYYPSPVFQPARGGLGLQAGVRGLQWSNSQAKDAIFWVYDVSNISEKNLEKTVFGILMGGTNGEPNDDNAKFYRDQKDKNGEKLNMAVSYDDFDVLYQAWVGYKFLESPGNGVDGIDNDADSPNADSYDKIDPNLPMFQETMLNAGDPIILTGRVAKDTVMNVGQGNETVWYAEYNGYERTQETMPNKAIVVWSAHLNDLMVIRPGDIVIDKIGDLIDNNLNGLIDENPTAHAGFAYKNYFTGLGVDDKMIDEQRDDNIDNDGDWNSAIDDVGQDGVPGTNDYGEGDGIPSFGEPNFDALDIDESDQIGLTSFYFFFPSNALIQRDDRGMWAAMVPGFFDTTAQNVDGDFIFSSGYFPLFKEKTERISVTLLFADNEEGLINKAATVQQIYNFNYNFAQAPQVPQLSAATFDRKVRLYWDGEAENSRDRIWGQVDADPEIVKQLSKDFEGYRLYRSNSPQFKFDVTNSYGEPQFMKPIAIFDLKNEIFGLSQNDVSGVKFNLGTDSGLKHQFDDGNLINGVTYYYIVTSFDAGYVDELYGDYSDLSQFVDITPSESRFSILLLPNGKVVTGRNVVEVRPGKQAIGYQDATTEDNVTHYGLATGTVKTNIVDPYVLKEDSALYQVSFEDVVKKAYLYQSWTAGDTIGSDTLWSTGTFSVVKYLPDDGGYFFDNNDHPLNTPDTLYDTWENPDREGIFFDGVELKMNNSPQIIYDAAKSGYQENGLPAENGKYVNYIFSVAKDQSFKDLGKAMPFDYDVEIYDHAVDSSVEFVYPGFYNYPKSKVNFKVKNITTGKYIDFVFAEGRDVVNETLTYGDQVLFLEGPRDGQVSLPNTAKGFSLDFSWGLIITNDSSKALPGAGVDLFLHSTKEFSSKDIYEFVVNNAKYKVDIARQRGLEDITVVPNPYIAASLYERDNPLVTGRGERAIKFMYLPPKCTIRIFTITGELVDIIEHDAPLSDDMATWDLKTLDNLDTAYGIYIYHINAPGIGEKIGKFAVIK